MMVLRVEGTWFSLLATAPTLSEIICPTVSVYFLAPPAPPKANFMVYIGYSPKPMTVMCRIFVKGFMNPSAQPSGSSSWCP